MARGTLNRLAAYRGETEEDEEEKGRGGLFGSGINLGLGSFWNDIKSIPGGLIEIGKSIAPGSKAGEMGTGQVLKTVGGGMAKSVASTLASVTPGVGIATRLMGVDDDLRKHGIEVDWTRRARERGILSTMFEDIGNVAIVAGGVGAVAGAGAKGAAAAGSVSRAARLGQVASTAKKVARPYQTAFTSAVSPVTRAAQAATGGQGAISSRLAALAADSAMEPAVRAAASEPIAPTRFQSDMAPTVLPEANVRTKARFNKTVTDSPDAPAPGAIENFVSPIDDILNPGAATQRILGDRRRTAEPKGPRTPDPELPQGRPGMGIAERAAIARQEAPIPQWAENLVGRLGDKNQKRLASAEARIQKREFRRVVREHEIMATAARTQALNSDEVVAMKDAARSHLVGKDLGGVRVTEAMADRMFADAVRTRATGVEAILDQLDGRVNTDRLVRRGIVTENPLPKAWLDENPDLDAAVSQAVEALGRITSEQYGILSGGRKGMEGLERVGTDVPIMTKTEQRAWRRAQNELKQADAREARAIEAATRAKNMGAAADDRTGRWLAKVEQAEDAAARASEFLPSRSPALFRSAQWGEVLRRFTRLEKPGDGATMNPMAGDVVVPAAFGGTGIWWAVGVKEVGRGGARVGERVPLQEWNTVVDPQTGTTIGDEIVSQIARDYQEALLDGNLSIGLWVDPDSNVSIDITQYNPQKPLSRHQARILAAARGQDAIFDFGSGDEVFIEGMDPEVARHFLDKHQARDRKAKVLDAAVRREVALAKAQGRSPRLSPAWADAQMDYMDNIAVHLHRTNPTRFPNADSAYAASTASLGKDASRLPQNSLFQVLPSMTPGTAGIGWWNEATKRFGNWEELAVWYDRSHEAIERDFRGQNITLLDGSQRDLADVMYDIVALNSVQNAPADDIIGSLKLVRNLQMTMQEDINLVRELMEEFREQGVTGPKFERFGGNYFAEAKRRAMAEAEASGETWDKKNKAQQNRLREIQSEIMGQEEGAIRYKPHQYESAIARMMPVLTGRPMDSWDAEYVANIHSQITGIKQKDLPWDKPGKADSPKKFVEREAERLGITAEQLFQRVAERRLAAMQADKGELGRASKDYGPEELERLGKDQIIREFYGTEAFAKLRSFRENLASPYASDAVTIDQWMDRLFAGVSNKLNYDADGNPVFNKDAFPKGYGKAGSGGGRYAFWANELRETARMLREQGVEVEGKPVRGHHVQALLWAYSMDQANELKAIAARKDPSLRGMPEAQDFKHIADMDPRYRAVMDEIAINNGFEDFDEMVFEGFREKLAEAADNGNVKFQRVGNNVSGATWTDEAGRVMERYFETADPSTFIHEGAHVLKMLLAPEDLQALERAYGIRNGVWSTAHEERFARDWETLGLRTGPVAGPVAGPLARLRKVVGDTWHQFRNDLMGDRIPQEAQDLHDRIFAPENLEAPPSKSEQALQAKIERSARNQEKRSARAQARLDRAEQGRAIAEAAKERALRKLAAAETAQAAAGVQRANAFDMFNDVIDSLDDPSLSRVPPHMQPIWHAWTSLIDEAAETGDIQLAQELANMGTGISDLMEFARARGFDPQYVPKMQPAQVKKVVMEAMKLGRGGETGLETQAGARKNRRYANPEMMDRSIAGLVGGYVDAVHEMHTNALVEYLEQNIAKPLPEDGRVPEGWVPWNDTRTYIVTGETLEGAKVGSSGTLMVPKEIDSFLHNYGKNYDHWTFRGIRNLTNPWRAITLPLRPAWYVNNVIGNMILASASGVGLKDWARAWQTVRQGQKKGSFWDPRLTGQEAGATAGGLQFELDYDGAARTTMLEPQTDRARYRTEREKGRGRAMSGLKAAENRTRRLGRANEIVDDFARLAVYFAGERKGLSEVEALTRAHQLMVDYGDLSGFERSFVRAAVPFYAWQKGVLKLAARYGADHPAVLGIGLQIGNLNEEIQRERYGVNLPRAYAGLVEIPGFGGALNTTPLNPFADAGSLTSVEGIRSSLNPFVEIAARSVMGAPEFGFSENKRVGDIGRAEDQVDVAGQLTDLLTFSAPGQAIRGAVTDTGNQGQRWLGLPRYRDDEIEKIRERTIKGEAEVLGLGAVATRARLRAAGIAAPEPKRESKRKSPFTPDLPRPPKPPRPKLPQLGGG